MKHKFKVGEIICRRSIPGKDYVISKVGYVYYHLDNALTKKPWRKLKIANVDTNFVYSGIAPVVQNTETNKLSNVKSTMFTLNRKPTWSL